MKEIKNTNIRRKLNMDELEEVNGGSLLVTVCVIGAWAAALTTISYFAGESGD